MTKAGYTHVLIPTSLHGVLKCKAQEHNISIWKLIEKTVLGNKNMAPMPKYYPDYTTSPIWFSYSTWKNHINKKYEMILRVRRQ